MTYALDCGTSAVALDIKPGSCPNPLNVKPFTDKGKGGVPDNKRGGGAANNNEAGPEKPRAVLPVAVLGTDQFDVMNVDPATVSLEGVPVKRWSYEDVATPVGGTAEECACSTDGPDGFTDLTLKFDKAAIVEALGEVEDGETIALTLTGELLDGTLIEGTDCVVIVNGGKKPPVVTKQETLPGRFALRQNYPNPFNPVTGISFTLPQAASVRLELFNVLGQTVTTLADGYLEAGEHTVSWDGASQASGVYFYRLTAGELVGTKKMMLLK